MAPLPVKTSFSEKINYFLWWLATADRKILLRSGTDQGRFSIIGMTVLATWLFATVAWTSFFLISFDSILAAILLGIFMGFIILCIDRAMIKGIRPSENKRIIPLMIRSLLAIMIGTFMAQPAVLYLFRKEVSLQILIDNESRKATKNQLTQALYSKEKTALENEKKRLQQSMDEKYSTVEKSRQDFIAETDGSGGSGKPGIKAIALAKKATYEKLEEDYKRVNADIKIKTDSIDLALSSIVQKINTENETFSKSLNDGFLTRITALNNLVENNAALKYRYYLIVAILVLIELMPVLSKSFLSGGSYEQQWQAMQDADTVLALANIAREKELKEYHNNKIQEDALRSADDFFSLKEKAEKKHMEEVISGWKDQSQDGLWRKIKTGFTGSQEY